MARRTSVTPAVLQVRRDDRGRAEEVGRGSAACVLRMQRRARGGKRGRGGRGGAVGGCHVQGPTECRGPGCHNGRRCKTRCHRERRYPHRGNRIWDPSICPAAIVLDDDHASTWPQASHQGSQHRDRVGNEVQRICKEDTVQRICAELWKIEWLREVSPYRNDGDPILMERPKQLAERAGIAIDRVDARLGKQVGQGPCECARSGAQICPDAGRAGNRRPDQRGCVEGIRGSASGRGSDSMSSCGLSALEPRRHHAPKTRNCCT